MQARPHRIASLGAMVRISAATGAAALLMAGPALAGDIDGAPLEEAATLTGAPLMAALAPATAVAEEAQTIEAPKITRLSARYQCVPYARSQSGVEIRGDAVTWWRQAAGKYERVQSPETGSVIVMRGYRNANRGHVAVVRHVLTERSIIIDHANWLASGEVTLNVPVVDVSPKNDWSQVRVWHIPTQTWGLRVYNVQGFILPGEAAPAGGAVMDSAR
ncbi:MAG: CHAP domain-containing protein [Hyphomonadaceae bacterium]|nr:CHAP domain-containing protein [Hyphomonadaceae bacterium]